ncbi:MAG: Na+/H+ antiporter NhaA [Planctomycetota bacterium]|jgi:NhaA family Na+:H+ antiporter
MAQGKKFTLPAPEQPIDRVLFPFQEFLRAEASGGILLLACTAIALIWANSPWQESYHHFWYTYVSIGFGDFVLKETLAHWVNDGLMAIFFFVVGLEIKREILVGELASPAKAAVPIAAAIGGMAVPALVYAALNYGKPSISGWAIPAATDIAFALGILALLGKRVPLSLKVFLTAVAIVDDIGAVLIIAMFYTSDIAFDLLGAAGGIFLLLIVANVSGIRRPVVYAVLGIALWLAFLKSGIHATVAGVLLAFTIPSRCSIDGAQFISFARGALDTYEREGGNQDDIMTNPTRQSAVQALEQACEYAETPLHRLEHELHPWVAYLIMPVFALANAGVPLTAGAMEQLTNSIGLGVMLGLVIGKQVGVTLFTWATVKSGLGVLPGGATWRQVYGAAWLAGIGFTMSLFVANLAFPGKPTLLNAAKVGILAGSFLCGVVGFLILRTAKSRST